MLTMEKIERLNENFMIIYNAQANRYDKDTLKNILFKLATHFVCNVIKNEYVYGMTNYMDLMTLIDNLCNLEATDVDFMLKIIVDAYDVALVDTKKEILAEYTKMLNCLLNIHNANVRKFNYMGILPKRKEISFNN